MLVTPDGAVVGSLRACRSRCHGGRRSNRWCAARAEHHGIDVTMLRLLETERDRPHGGEVTYLAEVARAGAGRTLARPARAAIRCGMPYAEPGGPAADLAWAASVLDRHGIASGRARRSRSAAGTCPASGASRWAGRRHG